MPYNSKSLNKKIIRYATWILSKFTSNYANLRKDRIKITKFQTSISILAFVFIHLLSDKETQYFCCIHCETQWTKKTKI
ncbi:hypothetical protein BpHYR1_036128 [Brachionus plicatilis]|uniref:Uncharacterized protein n=1 Tax=Brachionus plicatilis TaxID=10195 RepID=A0A3M7S5C8_BRAPC|nr:hypothetical protein BpHYR1_036128 [Brachionus plicatilis]